MDEGHSLSLVDRGFCRTRDRATHQRQGCPNVLITKNLSSTIVHEVTDGSETQGRKHLQSKSQEVERSLHGQRYARSSTEPSSERLC